MMFRFVRASASALLILLGPGMAGTAAAQGATTPVDPPVTQAAPAQTPPGRPARPDSRTQYPLLLRNAYVSVHVGYIAYGFSNRQLEQGFGVESVRIPHVTVQMALIGHQFNKRLSAQAAYMRPVRYVSYRNVNGDLDGHTVKVHFGGITLRVQQPISRRLSVSSEVGIGLTSRAGFERGGVPVVKDASFASAIVGAGLDYHVNGTWDLIASTTYLPAHASANQSRTLFTSGGFRYNLHPLPEARVEANRGGGIFPKRLLQMEITSGVGYSINTFLSRKVPVFWGGNVQVDRGFAIHYDTNVFHSRRLFSFDLGLSGSLWRSRDNRQRFSTLSAYPLLRLTFLRTAAADVYAQYSLAGPTVISQRVIDGRGTGHRFTFQDFIGLGAFIGKTRNASIGVKINHYSNGNLFTQNAGIKVPLTLTLGYAF